MKCPQCQTDNPPVARFCMNCGTALAQVTPAGEIAGQAQRLSPFIPPELIAKLEAARAHDAMMGERRVITMLFCDLKGSTAAAEKVDPEVWTEIVNGAFERMIRPVYQYEGTVPRLMGDAILAFFGAPIAHEDDPQRAVLAGLEIQQGMRDYAEAVRLRHGLEFSLRVGIHTGLVVVGAIGSDLRMEYTAIGDAINLAARMEQTAAPGTLQISAETYKLVAPFFDCEALGEVEVKGKSAPLRTYRPLRVKKVPGQLRGLKGLTSPLVGRDEQLALLARQFLGLRQGEGAFVAVIGEAGLGKSSLIAEARKAHADTQATWLKGESLSYSRSIGYYPWRQIIRQSIHAREEDPPGEVRARLRSACGQELLREEDAPFLEAMLAVESPQSAELVTAYPGEALVQRVTAAARDLLGGLAGSSALALVFDDLHWADEASLHLLASLADLSIDHPSLFICMLRPDKAAASWETIQQIGQKLGERFHPILLEPLPPVQTGQLLANLLGVSDLPAAVRDRIVDRAGGNPFFVEELIRSLIETGQLAREDGGRWAAGPSAQVRLPDTLRGVLGARIDRLPEATRRVLQNAAVIGRSFDLRVLEQLTAMQGRLEPHIQFLVDAGLIEPLEGEFAFRHVLIQEAAYDSVLLKSRSTLHRRIAEILEQVHAGRLEEFAPFLARHFYAAGDPRSLPYDRMAGEKAARLFANAEAAEHFSRALEVARAAGQHDGQAAELYSQLGQTLELAGRFDAALETYTAMRAFAQERNLRSLEIGALMAKATIFSIFSQRHNPRLSEQLLLEALDISREIGDRATQAKLNWNLMINYLFSKRPDQALEYGLRALSLARETGDREQLAFVLNDLCRLYTCRGEFEKAFAVIREARGLWQALDHQVMLADSFGSEAEIYFNMGEFPRSEACCRQALAICAKTHNLWGTSYNQMIIAFGLLEGGQLGPGMILASESIQMADDGGLIASSIGLRAELGWMHAYCGDFSAAYPLVEQALRVAESQQPSWIAFPQAHLVRMHLLEGDLTAARSVTGGKRLEPISIPYARYTILLSLANVELAEAEGDHSLALALADELLAEVMPLTRVAVPEALRWKAAALHGLGRLEEAAQTLSQAREMAEGHAFNLHLWRILADLAEVKAQLGQTELAARDRAQAGRIVLELAATLRDGGLRQSFLDQPRVQALLG